MTPAAPERDQRDLRAALMPVSLGHVAVQVVCALHVVVVRLRGLSRGH